MASKPIKPKLSNICSCPHFLEHVMINLQMCYHVLMHGTVIAESKSLVLWKCTVRVLYSESAR